MRYLPGFATEKDVMEWSCTYFRQPAKTDPANATKYFFPWIEKCDTCDEWAAIIPGEYISILTDDEQTRVQDRDFMESNGRFPVL